MAGQLGDGRFILVDIKKEMHEVHNEMENDVIGPYKVKKKALQVLQNPKPFDGKQVDEHTISSEL
uniref:Uncharacterized protein n=2 Tax=Oryza TaxID=4527 RepID=A0A0E0PJJ3_ORYRU